MIDVMIGVVGVMAFITICTLIADKIPDKPDKK